MRSFIPDDDDWGQWCSPIYLAIRSVSVQLLETSQDWMRVCWKNTQAKDLREKKLFITRIGQSKSVTVTLQGSTCPVQPWQEMACGMDLPDTRSRGAVSRGLSHDNPVVKLKRALVRNKRMCLGILRGGFANVSRESYMWSSG